MKRLLLRADASAIIGTGHVMRCIALAQAWQDLGGSATLLSHHLPPALASRVSAEGIVLHEVPADADDAEHTCVHATAASWVVIDGYHFDAAFCDRVVQAARHVIIIDDLGQLPHYSAELILNQNITASMEMYAQCAGTAHFLLNGRHALLRREFRQPAVQRQPDVPCKRVLVTLGGSDPHNVTLKIMNALLRLPQLQAKMVIGAANSHRDALIEHCSQSKGQIELLSAVENMVPLMDWAHMAVSAGGTSILELASRGLPTLLISIADNQSAICETMHQRKMMRHLGWHEDISTDQVADAIYQFASESQNEERHHFSVQSMQLVDGQGALRVAVEMMTRNAAALVRVRPATTEDALQVLDWTNDPVTRSASFNQAVISWEDHQAWFNRRLNDRSCRLLIAEDDQGTAFGIVRFDLDNQVATISINISPSHRRRGLGSPLIMVACRDVIQTSAIRDIRALIKPENRSSITVFERSGFRPAPDVDVTGQRALCMVMN